MAKEIENAINLELYLKRGGILSSPANLPARYRAYLLRIMTSFVDSEFAASAGYTDILNQAPGIVQRVNAARIIVEKAVNCEKILAIMSSLGADIECYGNGQNMNTTLKWADRVARNGDISAVIGKDMRLSVFHYPLKNWLDAVMMSVLIGKAGQIQLKDLSQISYAPLAEAFAMIGSIEQRHTNIGRVELLNLAKGAYKNGTSEELKASFHYWLPKVQAIFGSTNSESFEMAKDFGLRRRTNAEMLEEFNLRAEELRQSLRLIAQL